MSSQPQYRHTEIVRARAYLERFSWPRVQMAIIVLITGVAGFLSSYLLLELAGMTLMAIRYPLAILVAYGVFLLQMWAWTRWRDDGAAGELLDAVPSDIATGTWSGRGGGSGGGGSSASWEGSGSAGVTEGAADSLIDAVADPEAGLPLLVVVALAAVAATAAVAAGWVIWSAPALMAELMVDAAIAGGLYRRVRGVSAEGWWWLCVRHTMLPLIGVLLFFTAAGTLLQHLAPDAVTLLDALKAI